MCSLPTTVTVVCVILCFFSPQVNAQTPCTVCADGSAVTKTNLTVGPIPPFPAVTCGNLDTIIPALLNTDDSRCQLIQSVGSICGCPRPQLDEACAVCNVREDFLLTEVTYQQQAVTCELLQVSLSTSVESASPLCTEGQDILNQGCGCADNTATPPPTSVDEFTCTPCWDGSDYQRPDKLIADVASGYGFPGLPKTTTCDDVVPLVLASSSEDCQLMQVILGGLCGCPAAPGTCQFCPPDDYPLPRPDDLYIPSGATVVNIPTCQEASDMIGQLPTGAEGDDVRSRIGISGSGHEFCDALTLTSYVCGCHGGHRPYMGTSNERQRAMLAWTPRITGTLSIIGSVAILWDIYFSKRTFARNTFHGIVTGLSLMDLSSSLAWISSSAPGPEYYVYDYGKFETGVYGVAGNEATCQAQGFFLELGWIGSISFNLALCVYYLLVIVYGKKDDELKRWRLYLYGLPTLAAFAMAGAGIPRYEFAFIACGVSAPPSADTWKYVSIYVIGPISLVILLVTIIMTWIYVHVRRTSRAARRWNFGESQTSARSWRGFSSRRSLQQGGSRSSSNTNAGSAIEDAVFWQCSFYLLAFYVTWAFYYVGQFNDSAIISSESYFFWVAVVFFTPLQGFWNALVYARPRILRWYRARRTRKKENRQQRMNRLNGRPQSSSTGSVTDRLKQENGPIVAATPLPLSSNVAQNQAEFDIVKRSSMKLQWQDGNKMKDELLSSNVDGEAEPSPVLSEDEPNQIGQNHAETEGSGDTRDHTGFQRIKRGSLTLQWLDAEKVQDELASPSDAAGEAEPSPPAPVRDEPSRIARDDTEVPDATRDLTDFQRVKRGSLTLEWLDAQDVREKLVASDDGGDEAAP